MPHDYTLRAGQGAARFCLLFRVIAGFVFALVLGAGAAAACPDDRVSGQVLEVDGETLLTPQEFDIVAGGDAALSDCPGMGMQGAAGVAGLFRTAPDFTLNLAKMNEYSLAVSVKSHCDTMLLISGPTMSPYFDDDDNGDLNPRIVLTRVPDGYVNVWVGTIDGAACDARLRLQTSLR
ncbi:MAG: hypothetical protein GC146_05515 [Limimaricola sp.]|uniref:hypothetical protein n=1 Tax=Limimaricola sp. TaxID=2211665 RepID=UPI001DF054BB|nr:hypothetical protein [Limimaricola sp.]MBI1416665.1 hypothetical protein [Limimaricola sp.]